MGKFIDLSQKNIGNWKVLQRVNVKKNRTSWLCECQCGIHRIVDASHLLGGRSAKCKNCHNKEAVKKRPMKHGHAQGGKFSKEYTTWNAMRTRCLNPKTEHWLNYGGRGISIDERWNDFNEFMKDMGKRPKNHTLDRIDNNKNYCKENCHWATTKQQCENKRTNIFLEIDGLRMTKTEWARHFKIPYTSFARKIEKYGWPLPPPPSL